MQTAVVGNNLMDRTNCMGLIGSLAVDHGGSPESSRGSSHGHSQVEKRHICDICGKVINLVYT